MKTTCPHCWGSGTVADEQLSPNFRLSEFTRSSAAAERGLPNAPSPEEIEALRALCTDLLQPLRSWFGPIRVTSGYRSPAVNAAVGGVVISAHLTGDAADIVPVRVSIADVMTYLSTSGLAWDQAIDEGAHLHIARVSPLGRVQRRQLLMKRNGVYSPWARSVA